MENRQKKNENKDILSLTASQKESQFVIFSSSMLQKTNFHL